MRIFSLISSVIVGVSLIYGTLDMPMFGDPHSPANRYISPYYLEHTMEDAATPNAVTTLLADYRGFDTLGETTVIFTAGVACILLLRKVRKRQENQHD